MADKPDTENRSLSMMYGTYADVLFVLFPFLVICMQRLWDGDLYSVLLRPDLSIASAILAGLAIGKFVLGLVTERELGRFRERIVFFIALTLLLVMGPSLILILSILEGGDVPGFVAFVQPVLLIVAISLYTSAISITNLLTQGPGTGERRPEENEPPSGLHGARGRTAESLSIPPRTNL
ncbi:MAG TPA: hypothetical protein DHU56_08095 [Marinobacter sp.]|jgi:hypothetical protein|nr:hypothetical protein [Marinobacter sp.]